MKYYYEDKSVSQIQTKIVKAFSEGDKHFVCFEDHLYYPQGGGQKGDRGCIEIDDQSIQIVNTIKDETMTPYCIVEEDLSDAIGKKVVCKLDKDFRNRQKRLHTCLHLHHYAMEVVLGKEVIYPSLSTIEDGFAVNKYKEEAVQLDKMDEVNAKFFELIEKDLAVVTYADQNDENYRYWKCKDYVIPCGGIHVDTLKEIGKVNVQIKRKKKMVSVRIELEDGNDC